MSQDNININVQETNDIVNIVSSEVTEVIDINVAETTEQVTLNITEEVIQVNVNKVTNISPVNSVNGLTGDVVLDIPTATSDLTNDSGFITAAEVPTVNDATASVKGILKLTNDLGGTADLPTVPGLANKVDKVIGKGLSTNDYTTAEQTKLAGIAAGAEVNVNADWNATSGDAQILNKPTIPAAQIQSDWNQTNNTAVDYIKNKPIISAGISSAIASGTDTYSATITNVTSYADGDAYLIRFTNGNTTNCTLNINGLGAVNLYKNNDGALIGGDITAGGEMLCIYNSALNIFQVIGTAPNSLFAYVTNAESIAITKGQPVYVSGGTGDRITVKLAYNTGDSTSAQTIGLVLSTSIGANQKGLIITQGQIDNLSLFPTSTWADGDFVYLGATAGTLTKVKPSAPNHLVYLGYVTTANNGNAGRMYVKVQNGYELEELHNVAISSVSDKQLLSYDSATSLWKNKSVTTADIASSTNKNYVTDAQVTIINNTSGVNTGDETATTIKSKLGISVLSGSNTGDQDLSGLVVKNATITGATKTKITYDSKGLVTSGADATTADIADSTNKRYVTDANLTTIGNQSGTNTGDETNSTIKLKLGAATTSVDGYLTSTDWNTFNGKATKVIDVAGVEDNDIYSMFMNGAISYFLGSGGSATFVQLRINSNLTLSGQSAYFGNNAIQFTTAGTSGSVAFQRGVPFYHSGRSLMRFQPNIVSTDARYFVGISNLYQVSAPTNVEPNTLTQSIGVAKLSTSANLFIIHNDGTGVATSVDLGINYPAASNLYYYDIKITSNSAGAYINVSVRRTTISTNAYITYNYNVPGDYPTTSTNPALWITNNATLTANSLYHYGGIGYNTTI